MMLNKFAIFALANLLTIFMLAWVDLIPGWMVIIPIVQCVPLMAWASDHEENR